MSREHLAQFPGICDRCDRPISKGDAYVLRRGRAIHPTCAPGGDDE